VQTTQVMVNDNADTENTFVAVLDALRDEDCSVAPQQRELQRNFDEELEVYEVWKRNGSWTFQQENAQWKADEAVSCAAQRPQQTSYISWRNDPRHDECRLA
jgi:hypothetical protein